MSRIETDIFTKIPDGYDQNQTLELLKEIGALEESGAEAVVTSCGSIFIGLYCPNRKSLDILQTKLDNGQLKKDITNWLELEQLRHKYNLKSLEIEVNLKVLGMLISCPKTINTNLLILCCEYLVIFKYICRKYF